MQIGWSTLAFASGAVATTVVAVSIMSVNSQPVRDNAFHVCVAKDRLLRLVETDEPCPEGQQRLRLAEADTPDVEPPKDTGKEESKKAPSSQDAAPTKDSKTAPSSQERTSEPAELKKMPSAVTKVKAPFEVVDASGRTILRVSTDVSFGDTRANGLEVFGPGGRPLAALAVGHDDSPRLTLDSKSNKMNLVFGAFDNTAGLQIVGDGVVRGAIGSTKASGFGVRFWGPQGAAQARAPVAGLGVNGAGEGEVVVGDGTSTLAALVGRGGRGQLDILNSGGVNSASLGLGTQGGGKLQLTDAGGTSMVEAGNEGGVGVVRVGPTSGPGVMLPGGQIHVSRLVGKK